MSYTVAIPIEIVHATHRGGYYELYLTYVQDGYTSQAAYERIEAQLERYGLPCRYSSYETFRRCLYRMRPALKDWQRRKGTLSHSTSIE